MSGTPFNIASPIDPALLPSEADIRFYQEHGWYISPPILSDDVIDAAIEGVRRYFAGERDHALPEISAHFDWSPEKGEILRLNGYVSLQMRELRQLVSQSIIGAVAARLAGCATIRLFRDQLLHKPPASHGSRTRVGWHSDRSYWQTCTSERMLTAWIPLHDCDAAMGTLMMLDGSHLWPEATELATFYDQNLEELENRLLGGGRQIVKVPMELKRGQVSFHHCRTVHGSDANHGTRPRVALALHLQDGENRYRPHYTPSGQPATHLNDLLCRTLPDGTPDYGDPAIFPVLWNEQS